MAALPPRAVVHVLPSDLFRGAQTYARALRDALHSDESPHAIISLFAGDVGAPAADVALGIPPGRMRSMGLDLRAVQRLRAALRAADPRAVVAHGGEPLRYVAVACPRRTPIAYLRIGSHGDVGPARTIAQRLALTRVRRVLAVSSDAAADVHAIAPGIDVHIIPNGRDPSAFPSVARADRDAPTVIFVGHLDADKRPLVFIDAIRAVRARGARLRAVIVGDGPLADEVRRAAGDDVEVLGHRPDVPELLSAADVLVMTSRPPEGMPGVLIEAAFAGLPVVTTDVPGARDVVVDGETGHVVPIDAPDLLADRLAALVGDADARARMGAAGRARAHDRFTLDASIGQWRSVLDEMIDGVPPAVAR